MERNDWIEKGEKVTTLLTCPFCGYTGKRVVRWGNSYVKCPACKNKTFNRYATGTPGEKDKDGCALHSYEPLRRKNKAIECEELFL